MGKNMSLCITRLLQHREVNRGIIQVLTTKCPLARQPRDDPHYDLVIIAAIITRRGKDFLRGGSAPQCKFLMELRRRGEDKTRERGETERTRGDHGECSYLTASPISRDDGERNNPTVTVNIRHCEGNEERGVVYGVVSSLLSLSLSLFLSRVCVCITPRSEMAAEYG